MIFSSRNPVFRNPVGAIAQGQSVEFKISPERQLACRVASLVVHSDILGKQVIPMTWTGLNGEHEEWWTCSYTPPEKGLYFYYFDLATDRGHKTFYKGLGGEAINTAQSTAWQLTVYEKDFKTPNWLEGGIIYQIFPDRFYFSKQEKENLPSGRTYHENWGEMPDWAPNEKGVVTNSDYFKGDLKGIEEKLPYLVELGITCIYLNPIFEAHSNHRYNTANYSKIDPLLGNSDDFVSLCKKSESMGLKIILDGVFNHTGSDSVYFNRENRYKSKGAYNSQDSKFISWFNFSQWNTKYESWWGFETLPNVNQNNSEYIDYITGKNGIIQKWLEKGATGWRLDVADELNDNTLDKIYSATKAENPDAIVMGEVWEDASNKTAYGKLRRYLLGGQMDTVMNYPFRDAIIAFLCGDHSSLCMESIENIVENYPPQVTRLLMNHLGTHDTERVLTLLGGEPQHGRDRQWQSQTFMSDEQYNLAVKKMKLATLVQFTLPGVPSIYYGDEAGLQGYKDPFNRACFPWGHENIELLNWHKELIHLRKSFDLFKDAGLRNVYSHGNIMCFERYKIDKFGTEHAVIIAVNRSENWEKLPVKIWNCLPVMGAETVNGDLELPPFGYSVLRTI